MRHLRVNLVLVLAVLLGPGTKAIAAQDPQIVLWEAAIAGDTAALAQALKMGARIDSLDTRRTPNGRRALNWAALNNRVSAIRFLVAHGADVNAVNRTGFTPLHHAAEAGAAEAAAKLLELGADPSLQNGAGLIAMEIAAEHGNAMIVSLLQGAKKKAPAVGP